MRILIVAQEEAKARSLAAELARTGEAEVDFDSASGNAFERMHAERFDAVLLNDGGEELLREIGQTWPELPVAILGEQNDAETAVRCLHAGALDYLLKPVAPERLRILLARLQAVATQRGRPVARSSAKLRHPEAFASLIAREPRLIAAFAQIEQVAPTAQPVLIEGDSGTGKTSLADVLHRLSGRGGQFVPVSLRGLRAEEAAQRLFGMSGSSASASGSVELLCEHGALGEARGGTLFIEELADLDVALQGAVLEVVLASARQPDPPVRVAVATSREVRALRESSRLRDDLAFRLQACRVYLPPLRERPADLPLLLDHFLAEAAHQVGKERPTPPEELVVLLAAYHFPGNVRELHAMVHDAVTKHRSRKLSMATFKDHIDRQRLAAATQAQEGRGRASALARGGALEFPPQLPTLRETTNQLIDEAMRRASGKQSIAAGMLGISQSALSRRLKNRASGT